MKFNEDENYNEEFQGVEQSSYVAPEDTGQPKRASHC